MYGWDQGPEAARPLSYRQVVGYKQVLRLLAPSGYRDLFPKERMVIIPRAGCLDVVDGLLKERPFRPFILFLRPNNYPDSYYTALEFDHPELAVVEGECLRVFQGQSDCQVHLDQVRHLEWLDPNYGTVIECSE
jgi:hypothetical protein